MLFKIIIFSLFFILLFTFTYIIYIYIYIYLKFIYNSFTKPRMRHKTNNNNKVWYKLKYVLRIRVKCEIVVRIFKEFSDKVIGLMSFSIGGNYGRGYEQKSVCGTKMLKELVVSTVYIVKMTES